MKKFVLYALAIFSLTACTRYQYITLNSDIYQTDNQTFVWENDSVKVQYAFWGKNCPLSIQIYNKLNKPLYVDWSKSAVIYSDGSSFILWNDQASINSGTVSSAVNVGGLILGGSQTTGTIVRSKSVDFIPPASRVSVCPMYVRSTFIKPLPSELKKKQVYYGNMEPFKADFYTFNPNNSPFSFRCYLTLSTEDNFANYFFLDQPFWVSQVIETQSEPNNFLKADNLFSVNKTTGFGHVMQGVGVASLVVGAAYISGSTQPDYSHRNHNW
jgi:hypothetical protein